ncbi:MAG: FAD-dependent oxidoreductase [Desulfuromonadales bacterium]
MMRQQALDILKHEDPFDLLVIGGGATGCGVALDAATRGLRVALVEKNDFAEGTSSRSTKLLHGGVRYLETAVRKLDRVQFNLVRDGLLERDLLLQNAPHLTRRLSLVTPLYRWYEVPYVFAGLKLYDLLSGKRRIGHSRLLSRRQAISRFPGLKAEGLKAGVLYYDGQFHDARMALALAMTARHHGAVVANHVAVSGLVKEAGRVIGAELTDSLTDERWTLSAKGVVNAAGPFVDRIRALDDPAKPGILTISSGVHVVLDKRFAPPETGLLIPETEDGRVLFVLPWEGYALVGTTDESADASEHPQPAEEDIRYLLRHVERYFNLQVQHSDIKAAWAGLRPLVADPKAADTASLARDHVVECSASGLLTIAGGKWTTYRKMAQDTVDQAIRCCRLEPVKRTCQTHRLAIQGSVGFREDGAERLQKRSSLDSDIARHLHHTYGDQVDRLLDFLTADGARRLVTGQPMIEAEVRYAVHHEMAVRASDVLARRLSLLLLDSEMARKAAPRVIALMAEELSWDETRCQAEVAEMNERLDAGV